MQYNFQTIYRHIIKNEKAKNIESAKKAFDIFKDKDLLIKILPPNSVVISQNLLNINEQEVELTVPNVEEQKNEQEVEQMVPNNEEQKLKDFPNDQEIINKFIAAFKLSKIIADHVENNNTANNGLAYQHAYKMLVLFDKEFKIQKNAKQKNDTFNNMFKACENYLKVNNINLHDAFSTVTLASDGTKVTLNFWRGLIEKTGKKAVKLFSKADKIEEKKAEVEKIQGHKAAKSLQEAEDISSLLLFKRAGEFKELAKLAQDYPQFQERDFEKSIEIWENKKTKDSLPDITVNGNEVGEEGYVLTKLPIDDPRSLILGHITHCSQSIGGHSERCVIDGIQRENNGFYVLLKKIKKEEQKVKNDKGKIEYNAYEIIGQGYAWNTIAGNLCFDSWENIRAEDDKIIIKMLNKFAEKAIENNHIDRVTIGTSRKTPIYYQQLISNKSKIEKPKEGYLYKDAENQKIIKESEELIKHRKALSVKFNAEFSSVFSSEIAKNINALQINAYGNEKMKLLYSNNAIAAYETKQVTIYDLQDLETEKIELFLSDNAIKVYELSYNAFQNFKDLEIQKIKLLISEESVKISETRQVTFQDLLNLYIQHDQRKIDQLTNNEAIRCYQSRVSFKDLESVYDNSKEDKFYLLTSRTAYNAYSIGMNIMDLSKYETSTVRYLLLNNTPEQLVDTVRNLNYGITKKVELLDSKFHIGDEINETVNSYLGHSPYNLYNFPKISFIDTNGSSIIITFTNKGVNVIFNNIDKINQIMLEKNIQEFLTSINYYISVGSIFTTSSINNDKMQMMCGDIASTGKEGMTIKAAEEKLIELHNKDKNIMINVKSLEEFKADNKGKQIIEIDSLSIGVQTLTSDCTKHALYTAEQLGQKGYKTAVVYTDVKDAGKNSKHAIAVAIANSEEQKERIEAEIKNLYSLQKTTSVNTDNVIYNNKLKEKEELQVKMMIEDGKNNNYNEEAFNYVSSGDLLLDVAVATVKIDKMQNTINEISHKIQIIMQSNDEQIKATAIGNILEQGCHLYTGWNGISHYVCNTNKFTTAAYHLMKGDVTKAIHNMQEASIEAIKGIAFQSANLMAYNGIAEVTSNDLGITIPQAMKIGYVVSHVVMNNKYAYEVISAPIDLISSSMDSLIRQYSTPPTNITRKSIAICDDSTWCEESSMLHEVDGITYYSGTMGFSDIL